jgi:hypothetical protein
VANLSKILQKMESNPKGIKFSDLCKICDHYFGEPGQNSGSHRFYKTPWPGEPYVNIQNKKGMGKPYQVKQVLIAIHKMEQM